MRALSARLRGLRGLKSLAALAALLLGLGLVLACVCFASLWLDNAAITSDFFTTRHVDVTGNVRLSRQMVLQYGGLREGDNSLSVSIAKGRTQPAQTPWWRTVVSQTSFARQVRNKNRKSGALFFVHKNGVLLLRQ